MLFNSLQFLVFFVIVYAFYLLLPHRWQNRMLLLASYIFYGSWDVRFLALLIFSTTADYFFALRIDSAACPAGRRKWVTASLVLNLCILFFFKYFNFFVDSFDILARKFGIHIPLRMLNVVLPVGISFYTFQALSYTIDVYRGILRPTGRWSEFALYVAFFPQLVAGPIERATNLLPQVQNPRTVSDYGISHGAYLILWGIFQKVVIADNVSVVADSVFGNRPDSGLLVLVGIYAFAVQIYCDFAGYSNIARGLAFMLGFRLVLNFRNPYFAENPRDFWQRWHISLSSWLRDYLYIALGGNRGNAGFVCRNLMLTMLLGGLWHGAAWTFIVWGFYHGVLLILHRFFKDTFRLPVPVMPSAAKLCRILKIVFFFHLICLSWLFFRSSSMTQVFDMLSVAVNQLWPADISAAAANGLQLFYYALPLAVMEIWQYREGDPLVVLKAPRPVRVLVYMALFYGIIIFARDNAQSFIYFQF